MQSRQTDAVSGWTESGDASFYQTPRVLRLPQERRGHLPRRLEFASREGQGPLTVGRREAFGEVVAVRRELSRAREGGFCFIGGEAFGIHHRLPVGRLKAQPAVALCDGGLDLLAVRQRPEHRLSLGDLRHLRRRRESLQRGGKNSVSVEGAPARLIEPGERKPRAQLKA